MTMPPLARVPELPCVYCGRPTRERYRIAGEAEYVAACDRMCMACWRWPEARMFVPEELRRA